jgi:hypothetical protein
MMAAQQLKQVVGYVPAYLKEELAELKAVNRRLSESGLIEEALMIAMPQLKERHLPFNHPTHGAPGRKTRPRE